MKIHLASAPVSWGVLLKDTPDVPPYTRVLDEIRDAGYTGTELGPYGYLPLKTDVLRGELKKRGLSLLSAYVPINLVDVEARTQEYEEGITTARFLSEMGCQWIVLSDALFVNPVRSERAGRIRPEDGLTPAQWDKFAQNSNAFAFRMRDEFGLKTIFHPHVGSWVETASEVDTLLSLTDPALVGLCLETGHSTYGGDDPIALCRRWGRRIRYLHLKDCDKKVLEGLRARGEDYFAGVQRGVFPELGKGSVEFAGVIAELTQLNFEGWGVVEQDVLPGQGADPLTSARRNREYLRKLGVG